MLTGRPAIAECEAGSPHVQESMLRSIRAWMRLGRDDVRGALADADAALTLARQAGGEEGLLGAIMWKIRLNVRLGRLDQAGQLASEALTHDPSAGALFVVHGLAWHSQQLGLRTAELAPWVAQVPDDLPTRRDVELALAGDFAQLADRARDRTIAAENHRRAAEEDLKRGRNRQAAGNAEKALDFYHSVRATRFIREAETLLETARESGGVPTPSNAGGMK
jgi:hypothetical protein